MGGGAPGGQPPGSLFGRDDDLAYITAFADRAAVSGGALLLSGEAGVGKTVLLDAAAAHAEAAGSRVLRAAGAEFEREVSFACLNQLLHPLLDRANGLSPAYRRALGVGRGVREGPCLAGRLCSNAPLARLTQPPAAAPVLTVVDALPGLAGAGAWVFAVGPAACRAAGPGSWPCPARARTASST